MSTAYPSSTRQQSFGKAPIKREELCTSIQVDCALTNKPEQKKRSRNLFLEESGKSSQAAGAIEEVAVIRSEMTRVDERRGEQCRWMVAIMLQ